MDSILYFCVDGA